MNEVNVNMWLWIRNSLLQFQCNFHLVNLGRGFCLFSFHFVSIYPTQPLISFASAFYLAHMWLSCLLCLFFFLYTTKENYHKSRQLTKSLCPWSLCNFLSFLLARSNFNFQLINLWWSEWRNSVALTWKFDCNFTLYLNYPQ